MSNPYKDKIIKAIQNLGYRYSNGDVFSDFIELSALATANSVDKSQFDKREERYGEIIKGYSPDEQKLFPHMFADLVLALEYELTWSNKPVDILGQMFHELELHNKYKGQFFTPQHICDFMGKVVLGDCQGALNEKGYISICEPTCGSGAMILGFACAMLDENLNYNTQLVVTATDIDLKCVHMCYLQLALYGIPAVVIHGNTITMEAWSYWFTPVYELFGWRQKTGHVKKHDRHGVQTPEQNPEQLNLFEKDNK